ncbi:MAG: helix-turn-helix transcriptional regulator [Bacteroidetes bacterium]|nr:helix-turn-helix transcriptional regulator [Bacteroidota bacterium]
MIIEQSIVPVAFPEGTADVEQVLIDDASQTFSLSINADHEILVEVDKNYILFFLSDDCTINFELQDPAAGEVMNSGCMMMFSYPFAKSQIIIRPESDCKLNMLAISIGKLHSLFGSDFGVDRDALNTFMGSFKMKKYFTNKPIHPEVSVIFYQMFNHPFSNVQQKLYLQGKVMEIISYFLKKEEVKSELEIQCPFVSDHLEMEKIKAARDIVVGDLQQPPSIRDLARAVGTNEYKLKIGFKSMFGTSVYAYLSEYRMQRARQLLEKKGMNIKEIAHRIGYANPSHFIAAYKKKFGITPKKHLKRTV